MHETKILGLSFYYHDSAAVLLIDGLPVLMAEEERFSRKKHDSEFPEKAINFILTKSYLKPEDIDYVVFYEKLFLKLERIIKTNLSTFPWTPHVFKESVNNLFSKKLWIKEIISKKIGISPEKILFSEHHLSHAASTYFCSPYDESAILTIDGVGEWAATTISIGKGNKIKILKEIRFPHSLGLFYSAFTAFLGFEVNDGEYKVMGMASYGKPVYTDKVKKLIKFFDDGSYELDMRYFLFHRSLEKTYSKRFIGEFGRPRDPESELSQYYADLAASVQKVLEESVIRLSNEAHRITGSDKLCYAGGVALNSAANWKIKQNSPFKEIFIQPAAGDSGGALGAALAVYHQALNKPRNFAINHAYYGAEYSDTQIKNFLKEKNIAHQYFGKEEDLLNHTAVAISEGKVIGWFQDKFEWGPRALGARSILADPRKLDMKDIINAKVKFREPYRPFAPSILAEKAEDFFDISDVDKLYPARFMLYVLPVRENIKNKVPAITHVDGTSRPQLVFKKESPRYHRLIEIFNEKTGIPLLLNTSFNLKGEPIVNSPEDAYSTFIRSGLDILVMGNYVITK